MAVRPGWSASAGGRSQGGPVGERSRWPNGEAGRAAPPPGRGGDGLPSATALVLLKSCLDSGWSSMLSFPAYPSASIILRARWHTCGYSLHDQPGDTYMSSNTQLYKHQKDPFLKQIASLIFWALAVMIVLHVEGFSDRIGGGSIYILTSVMSMFLICIVYVRITRGLGAAGIIFTATIMSYLIIGLVVTIFQGVKVSISEYKTAGVIISFLLIFTASALGGCITMEAQGIEPTFMWILCIFIMICAVIAASPTLISYGLPLIQYHSFRHSGPYIDPNNAGIVGCLTITMAINFLRFSKYKKLAYLAISTGFIAVLSTGSKTAIVVSLIVVVFFLSFGSRRINILLPLTLLTVFIVIFWEEIFVLLFQQHLNRLTPILALIYGETLNSSDILTDRGLLWQLGIQQAMESPIFGHGFSQAQQLEGAPYLKNDKRLGVHNIYLLMIIEAGIIPVLLYFLYLFLILRLFFSTPISAARDIVIGWTFVLILVGNTFHHLFTLKVLAFIIGLSCATGQSLNSSRSARNPSAHT